MQVAVEWYVCLNDPAVTPNEQEAFGRWLAQSEKHRQAWEKLQQVEQPFTGLNANLAQTVFFQKEAMRVSRRASIKKLAVLLLVSGSGAMVYRERPWQTMLADYTTAKGERRKITLPDQTMIVLNSDTALDIQIDASHRHVHLIKGEIMIETGHPSGIQLPFKVLTRYGNFTAMGTRFSVRNDQETATLNVFSHAVKVQPAFNLEHSVIIKAGESISVNAQNLSAISTLTPGSDLWLKGILSVNDMPLREFLSELERYHDGYIRCDDSIAHLPVSGAYPISQLPNILSSLEQTYHLKTVSFTRFWTQIKQAT